MTVIDAQIHNVDQPSATTFPPCRQPGSANAEHTVAGT